MQIKSRLTRMMLIAFAGATVSWLLPSPASASCAPPHQMKILDLDMFPDPLHEGQAVKTFTVTVRSDRNGECQTAFEVRDDGNDVAGRSLQFRLLSGTHQYKIPAMSGYRFQRRDHCFKVVAMIANTHWVPIDGEKVECARMRPIQVNGWTLNR
jgi:hypothetical protein